MLIKVAKVSQASGKAVGTLVKDTIESTKQDIRQERNEKSKRMYEQK